MLNYVGMFSVDVTAKGHVPEVEQIYDFQYSMKSSYRDYTLDNHQLDLFYSIENEKDMSEDNCTNSGTLMLKIGPDSSPIAVDLSLVYTDKLKDRILLNDLAYDLQSQKTKVRGSSFYFSNYDPETEGELTLPELTANTPGLTGMFDKLASGAVGGKLYDEYGDKIFLGDELLAFATNEKIYLYSVNLVTGAHGGYFLWKEFDRTDKETPSSNIVQIKMKRRSAIVNASFILIDTKEWNNENSYFKMTSDNEPDSITSEANFLEKFGVNLGGMTCPYATMDGINTVYDINDRKSEDNTYDPGRLLLWADGYQTIAPDGNTYNKRGMYTASLSYAYKEGKKARGLGIRGNSYSVVFKGSQNDTKYQDICFYVTVDGVNIKIKAYNSDGISLSQNVSKNIIVMVDAQSFANYVKSLKTQASSRAGSNEYATFEVPEGSVVVQ